MCCAVEFLEDPSRCCRTHTHPTRTPTPRKTSSAAARSVLQPSAHNQSAIEKLRAGGGVCVMYVIQPPNYESKSSSLIYTTHLDDDFWFKNTRIRPRVELAPCLRRRALVSPHGIWPPACLRPPVGLPYLRLCSHVLCSCEVLRAAFAYISRTEFFFFSPGELGQSAFESSLAEGKKEKNNRRFDFSAPSKEGLRGPLTPRGLLGLRSRENNNRPTQPPSTMFDWLELMRFSG